MTYLHAYASGMLRVCPISGKCIIMAVLIVVVVTLALAMTMCDVNYMIHGRATRCHVTIPAHLPATPDPRGILMVTSSVTLAHSSCLSKSKENTLAFSQPRA